jgi:hypothetical protein
LIAVPAYDRFMRRQLRALRSAAEARGGFGSIAENLGRLMTILEAGSMAGP